jgi:hypothetical protein
MLRQYRKRLLKPLIRNHKFESGNIVTDKLRGYCVAHLEVISESIDGTDILAVVDCMALLMKWYRQ